jgi:phytoene desaturase
MAQVAVIGSGFSGLAAACSIARDGMDVTVFEKNLLPGGRARKFTTGGFTFDMGPSWYWMPDVFETFFNRFGKTSADYYELIRLDPSYRIFFGKDDYLDVPAGVEAIHAMFERIEPGSGKLLTQFLSESKFKYEAAINNIIYKNHLRASDLLQPALLKGLLKLHVFQSVSAYIQKFFRDPRLIKLLQFPVLFLGATPEKTPALYTLMNYADMALGTWYPKGGMFQVVQAMVSLAESLGVKFSFASTVEALDVHQGKVKGIVANQTYHACDYTIAAADYEHVEQQLLPSRYRRYSTSYWNTRLLAPSGLLFYVGLNKKLENLRHHTLFFDQDFSRHAAEIYDHPQWPTLPQFYISCPSKTDSTVSARGHENLMILMPVASGLKDEESTREKYFDLIMNRLETLTGESVREHIIYKRSYAHNDFQADYNAFKGNAYGLANTLFQTANFKPSPISRKVKNLFYAGQLTVPGPGVPPSIISGEMAAAALLKQHKESIHNAYEKTV